MAVEAVVSYVVGKLDDLLSEEACLLHGVRDQIELIETELTQMQRFLKDADAKQKEDERIKIWAAQIRNISYDAEDVIDTFISKVARRRRQGFVELLKRYSCIFTELITRHKVGKEIQRIKVRIDCVSSYREKYGIKDINEATSTNQNLNDRRRNFALLEEPDVVGFKEYRETLKEQLINGDSRRVVISIVGMGGSGKTTLTKKVYRDVEKYFDCRAFIYLSQQYKIRDILIHIIQHVMSDVSQEEMEKANEQALAMKLSDYLTMKTYLVVIDDIWTMEAWDTLNLILPNGLNKSRVMLTTRIREVALHADPLIRPLEICLLNDTESWELFLKKVFPLGSTCPSELEKTGKQILAKCGRLPLAIVVLGGLLSRRDKALSAWSKVLESVPWHLAESSHKCMEILALSYYDLPHYLKPCFLYLGLFPEDFEIKSKRLLRLWIAEGFIRKRGNEILEDVAEDYLEELIGRSMLQVASKRSNGSVRSCRIHDILRDLSIFEAKQNNFFETIGDDETISSSTSKHRSLALYRNIGTYDTIIYHSPLRSMLCFHHCELDLSKLFRNDSKLLRVLDVEDGKISLMSIPKEMKEFCHLRYLNFGSEIFVVHPTCFSILNNLQTLTFNNPMVLPNRIWDLERLRHLNAFHCKIEGQPRLHNLRNLQTLRLEAGNWIEDGLDKLTNLRNLGIFGDIGRYYSNILSQSIEKLCNLRSLKIADNSSSIPFKSFTLHLHLYKMCLVGPIEKLHDLPPNLTKLTLEDSQLQQDDLTKLEKLQHLQILELWGSTLELQGTWNRSEKWICSSEGFPRLEILQISGIKEWIVEEGAMPCLKSVSIHESNAMKTVLPERVRNLLT